MGINSWDNRWIQNEPLSSKLAWLISWGLLIKLTWRDGNRERDSDSPLQELHSNFAVSQCPPLPSALCTRVSSPFREMSGTLSYHWDVACLITLLHLQQIKSPDNSALISPANLELSQSDVRFGLGRPSNMTGLISFDVFERREFSFTSVKGFCLSSDLMFYYNERPLKLTITKLAVNQCNGSYVWASGGQMCFCNN